MALAALIVSVFALVASGASALYARRQAHAQDEATAIERDRRLAERAPDFETEIEDVNNNFDFFRLWVTVTSSEPLDTIAVELPSGCVFRFAENINGVRDSRHAESYQGVVGPGERACWRIELPDTSKEKEAILIQSTSGSDRWAKRVTVVIPPTNLGIY